MIPLRSISSVQREFEGERATLRDYVHGDPLMRRFFDVFLFEDAPASNRRPDELYLDEVECCDVYVGLFGDDYGDRGPGRESRPRSGSSIAPPRSASTAWSS